MHLVSSISMFFLSVSFDLVSSTVFLVWVFQFGFLHLYVFLAWVSISMELHLRSGEVCSLAGKSSRGDSSSMELDLYTPDLAQQNRVLCTQFVRLLNSFKTLLTNEIVWGIWLFWKKKSDSRWLNFDSGRFLPSRTNLARIRSYQPNRIVSTDSRNWPKQVEISLESCRNSQKRLWMRPKHPKSVLPQFYFEYLLLLLCFLFCFVFCFVFLAFFFLCFANRGHIMCFLRIF